MKLLILPDDLLNGKAFRAADEALQDGHVFGPRDEETQGVEERGCVEADEVLRQECVRVSPAVVPIEVDRDI